MKGFVVGVILSVAVLAGGLYAYMASGRAPVATSEPPLPMEEFLAKTALHARLDRDGHVQPPIKPSPAVLLAGARVYRQDCAACHGLPGEPVPTIAKGMFPKPPQLLARDEMVTDDAPGVIFWKAKNGIRLSGMPGFRNSLSDEQLWHVSLLLAHADKLPPEVHQALGGIAPPSPPTGQDTSK
jgi:thiosulfate dehydrogenase